MNDNELKRIRFDLSEKNIETEEIREIPQQEYFFALL